jgi:hypothetical protein
MYMRITGWTREWGKDAVAGLMLVTFLVSSFVLADAVHTIITLA